MFINGTKTTFKRYSSGELKLLHKTLLENAKNDVVNILYNNNTISFFELMLIIKYFTREGKLVNLTLTYLPYQRMDHNNGYEVKTLQLVADLLNELNLNSLIICEPHCPITYFKNAKSISFVELIFKNLEQKKLVNKNNSILFFTDKGAKKRYEHLGSNFITGQKHREKETGLISSYELIGKIEKNKQIILIDDIISTGDTMICALEELSKHTKQEVIIICGHLEKNKYNKRLVNLKNVKQIYTTNSLTKRTSKKTTLFKVEEILNGK